MRLVPALPEYARKWWGWRHEQSSQRFNPLDRASAVKLAGRLSACGSNLKERSFTEYRWIVVLGSEPIGTVGALVASWRLGYAELSYMIGEKWHGRGLGTRAVGLAVDKFFGETDLGRLFVTISVDNVASQHLASRLGFVVEGRLRAHFRIQGRPVDQLVMGLLRQEWLRLRARGGGKLNRPFREVAFEKPGSSSSPGGGGKQARSPVSRTRRSFSGG